MCSKVFFIQQYRKDFSRAKPFISQTATRKFLGKYHESNFDEVDQTNRIRNVLFSKLENILFWPTPWWYKKKTKKGHKYKYYLFKVEKDKLISSHSFFRSVRVIWITKAIKGQNRFVGKRVLSWKRKLGTNQVWHMESVNFKSHSSDLTKWTQTHNQKCFKLNTSFEKKWKRERGKSCLKKKNAVANYNKETKIFKRNLKTLIHLDLYDGLLSL